MSETNPSVPSSTTPAQPPPSPPPRRGPRALLVLSFAVVAVACLVLGAVLSGWLKRGGDKLTQLVAHDDAHSHADSGDGGYFTCGMHPWVILPAPGLCPICHMELTPLDPAKLTGEIAIDPVIVQNIGVRIAPVTQGPLTKEMRTVGTVSYDETAVRVINSKVGGWIEDLYVDTEGVAVERGARLFSVYSPELYAAQEEYLLAYRNRDAAPELLEAARTRLRYFDIDDEQIASLEANAQPSRTLTIHSPHAGVVVEKLVNEGARIDAGSPTYRVADLSRVWVNVTLYEYQLPFVKVGQPAVMTLPFLPGRSFEGAVAYVYPYMNEESRQVRVRLEFANDEAVLKPGMFANVELRSHLDDSATLAPREAILRTGSREVAFVSLGDGRFEPRTIRTGVETMDGLVEVLEGLEPGESVVTSGQFLLDSESKMRIALAKMVEGDLASEPPPPPAPVQAAAHIAPESQAAIDRIVTAYLQAQTLLAADQTQGLAEAFATMRDAAMSLEGESAVAAPATQLAAAAGVEFGDIAAAREALEGVSAAVIDLVHATPPTTAVAEQLIRATCPMVKADWLQTSRDLANPYMGSRMLKCGTIEEAIAPVAASDDSHAGHVH